MTDFNVLPPPDFCFALFGHQRCAVPDHLLATFKQLAEMSDEIVTMCAYSIPAVVWALGEAHFDNVQDTVLKLSEFHDVCHVLLAAAAAAAAAAVFALLAGAGEERAAQCISPPPRMWVRKTTGLTLMLALFCSLLFLWCWGFVCCSGV